MSDPTYDINEIKKNNIWHIAWILSEMYNDNAPLGWSEYIEKSQILSDNVFTNENNKVIEAINFLRSEELESVIIYNDNPEPHGHNNVIATSYDGRMDSLESKVDYFFGESVLECLEKAVIVKKERVENK